MDGDEIPDNVAIDIDGDGIQETLLTDTDVDGFFDLAMMDTDDSGVIDHVVIEEDVNGNLEFDAVTEMEDWDENDVWGNMETVTFELAPAEAYNEYDHFDPAESDGSGIVGDPEAALDSWHTQSGNTCAVVSQEGILESILGQKFDEDELRELAEDNGWYNNGTSAENVGQLLEYYGIHTEHSFGNSIDDLRDSLEDGNQIIVMVDADELWSGENEEMFGPGMDMDHAVRVIGIDESDPENPMVIINDSGVANGRGVVIPYFNKSPQENGYALYPIYCSVTILWKNPERILDFTIYHTQKDWQDVDYSEPVGRFKHKALEDVKTREEYLGLCDRVFDYYDKMVQAVLSNKPFAEEAEMAELFSKMMAPPLYPYYEKINKKFYSNFYKA